MPNMKDDQIDLVGRTAERRRMGNRPLLNPHVITIAHEPMGLDLRKKLFRAAEPGRRRSMVPLALAAAFIWAVFGLAICL